MECPRCKSKDIKMNLVAEVKEKKKSRGLLYWLFIGWWLEFILWFFFTIPRLFIALFGPKRKEKIAKIKTFALCQNCGKSWEVK